MKLSLIPILLGLIMSEIFAQFSLEKMVKTKNNVYLILGIFGYVLVSVLYFFLLKGGAKLAIANATWNVGTNIGVLAIGYFYFKDKLSHKQLLGLALAISAGLLLN